MGRRRRRRGPSTRAARGSSWARVRGGSCSRRRRARGAGALEAIYTALARREQTVPPTITRDEPDPECDLDYVPQCARRARLEVALSNSFGFGGTNAALVFGAAA